VTDSAGRTGALGYDANGRLTSITQPDPDGAGPLSAPVTAFGYGTGYRVTSVTDAIAQTTSFSYDTTGRLSAITHPDANTIALTAIETIGLPTGTTGNTISPADPMGNVTNERSKTSDFRTDRFGYVTQWIDPLDHETLTERNADGLPIRLTQEDPDGTEGSETHPVSIFGYDDSANLVYQQHPDDTTQTWTYTTTSFVATATDELGNITEYGYDAYGNLDEITDPDGNVTTIEYTSRGMVDSITTPDPDGTGTTYSAATTEFTYDTKDRVTTITYPDDATRTYTYNTADQILTETNELSDVLTIECDGLGRVTSVEDREGHETTYTYDAIGQLKEIEDALGNDTDYTYNNRGWVTEILRPDPDGVGTLSRPKTEYGYDAAGNLASIGESRFGTAPYEYTYDDAGRKTRLDRDGLTSVTYTYDNLNRLIESKVGEQYGLETRYEYNWRGQATSIMEIGYEVLPEGILSPTLLDRTWTLGYDDAGQLLEEIDPRGNVTAYVYNSRGLVSEIYAPDPDGSSPETSGPQLPSRTSFEYDDMGRLIAIQDALLRTTSYAYNARDWVTQVTLPDPDGTGSQTSATISMTYDDAGNVLTETDPLSQVTTYTYDAEGRLLTITGPDPDGSGSLSQPVMTYTYNAVGSVLTLTEPGGAETSWDYDHLQRVIEITEPDPDGTGSLTSPVTTIEYGSNTLISQITDPLSRENTFQYDSYGNRTSITDDAGNTTTYTYNDEHLVTSVLAPDPDGAGPQAAPETEYTYNVFHQVIAAIDPNDGMTVYEYDDAGNLISLTDPEENETTFAYDGQGRLTLETNEQGDYRSYQYDLAGNLTRLRDRNGRVLRYHYDNLDQMTSETWRSSADPGPELEIETTSQGGPVDEVQRVGYTDMMLFGGTFTLTYSGQTTAAISHGASAATVQTALEALSNIDSGDVSVTKSADTFEEQEWTIEYQGSLAGTNVSQMTIDASNILGGMGTLVETEATDTQGSQTGANETQTVTLSNATGGTFRLASGGYLTADLDYDATASEVETALEALNAIDDVTVTGSAGGPWTIVYGGDQAGEDVSRLDGDVTGATTGTLERTISYTYDAAGQLTAASDPDSSYAVTYDNLGRVTEVDNNNTTGVPRVILDTAYNAAGDRATLAATVAGTDDFLNTYTYDDLHRLTTVTQDSQTGGNSVADKRVDLAYNAIGQFTSIVRYNDVAGGSTNEVATGTYTYDTLGRLAGLAYTKGGTNLFTAYGWSYDSLASAGMSFGGGNGASDPRVAATAASAVYSAPGRVTQMTGQDGTSTYSYDITSQLTAATHTFQTNESYSYDDNGNRDMTGYLTGDDNQMTNDGTYSYTYDKEGNRTRRTNSTTSEVTDYEWDYRNRLTKVTEKNSSGTTTQVVEYIYDVFDRRIGKEVDTTSPFDMADAAIERYVYDDIHNSLASLDGGNVVLDFVDDDASDSTPIALSKRYLHGDVVDQVLAQEDVSKTLSDTQRVLWPLVDNLGHRSRSGQARRHNRCPLQIRCLRQRHQRRHVQDSVLVHRS
jgi:YD repeat-containing protein